LQNAQDRGVPAAVAAAGDAIAGAIDAIVERLRRGGRLVYVGAGTSGRLAALDAAECGPTFSTEVLALVAGGPQAPESAEDDAEAGRADLDAVRVSSGDAVVAVSASGTTPYTVAALEHARAIGALTVALVCVSDSRLGELAEYELVVDVGPELIAGSTRLKAGTAQKLVLNMISTISMVRLGRTFGNLMVDVQASNEKLRARARRAVAVATGASPDAVDDAISAAEGDTKVALVALAAGVDVAAARARLAAAGGNVREALDVVG
jgi:N-acetylmuramic acid 6-phosphate etherase